MKKLLVVLAMSFIGSSFSQSFMTGGLLTSFYGGNVNLGGNVSFGKKFDYSEFMIIADINVIKIDKNSSLPSLNGGLGLGYTFNEIYTPYIGATWNPGGLKLFSFGFETGMLFTFDNFLTGVSYDSRFQSLSVKLGFYLPER